MEKLLLIMNPCAGQKKGKKLLSEIVEIFNRAGFTVITYITAGHADAEAACIRYAAEVDRIVCCGGDGTFNETVSGVLKSGRDIPIGYIPAGSTNDFAASLGLSTDVLEAARNIAQGEAQWVDVGSFGDRYFSYVASFGAFTKTSYTTPQSMKNLLGHTAYVLSSIQELFQIRSYPVRVTLFDGTVIENEFIFGAISNSTSVGGVLTLAADRVDMADGKFELLLIRAPKDLLELSECVRALQQKTYDCAMITLLNTPQVQVVAPKEMPWTLDGEQEPGHGEVTVTCMEHAIRVFTKKE